MKVSRDQHLARLATRSTLEALAAMGFDWAASDTNLCAALRLKRETEDPAAIVAFVGGASSGKSTLFNSLMESQVSRISAHAHETLGPVIGAERTDAQRLKAWVEAGLVFESAKIVPAGQGAATIGSAGSIHLYEHEVAALSGVLVADLPDVTSKMSADEGSVAHNLMPLFDGLIVVVDEERWFDATVWAETVERFRDAGARMWIVFNRSERADDTSAADVQRLAAHARSLRADGHCVCPYVPGSGYRAVGSDTRATLLSWAAESRGVDRVAALESVLQRRSAAILRANVDRADAFNKLARGVEGELDALAEDTSLSLDLLTQDERSLLGVGHRLVPLYDFAKSLGAKLRLFGGARPSADGVDFDKQPRTLAEVLERNLSMRFKRATDRIDTLIGDSGYLPRDAHWSAKWSPPSFDSTEWANRIRAHIEAWKAESTKQAKTGDAAALSVGVPLLLADILFLGGAGVTLTWASVWIASLLGGKGLVRLVQGSKAYDEYRTTVRAYQAFLRESLAEQWRANVEAMPRRHMKMTDPVLEALMAWSVPR